MDRRTFLIASGAALLGTQCSHAETPEQAWRKRFAVSTWSFHNYFPDTRYGKPEFAPETWTVEKVVRVVEEHLRITQFELSSAHLASREPKYLDELNRFMKEQNCRFVHLSDNMRGVNLARGDAAKRAADLKAFVDLLDVAKHLQIPTMRVNTGTPETPEWDLKTTIESFRTLAREGKDRGVEILVENHFGISADPRKVLAIVEAVGENISTCPDFGLFANPEDRKSGLPLMFQNARRVCSAKFHGIGDQGQSKDFNLKECYEVLQKAKFPGLISFEYEGNSEPLPHLGRMQEWALKWLL